MTENCQNYLSLGVVQNEKSVQAVLRCLSFFGLSFVFKQHISFNTSSSRFILQNQCDFLQDIDLKKLCFIMQLNSSEDM